MSTSQAPLLRIEGERSRPASRPGVDRFCLVLIKPSRYDEEGYVVQWFRSAVPSNTLACIYGLAMDCVERRVLGENVAIEVQAFDETNTRIRFDRVADDIENAGAGMVMLVGVQSGQFPRAVDIAARFRKRGIAVGIGGFHVSGTIAMLEERDPDVARAEEMGISLFAGEAEGRLERVVVDAWNGKLQPLYNYMEDLPGIGEAVTPILPADRVSRTWGSITSFDAGRGCPYQCSFCTIINVQGRKSRHRSADDVERLIRENLARGLYRFFITDDNFARNRNWEAILDRIIDLRQQGLKLSLIIQVDTLCHKIDGFIEKCVAAGVNRVFIGLENINPGNLMAANKRQNRITEYRKMLLAWKQKGVVTYCGYILGFPNDTPQDIAKDIRIIQKELPVDLLEFFILTPLPGSEDHKKLLEKGVWMDPDLNRYDAVHVVSDHPRMTKAEWEGAFVSAWDNYYTFEHMETVMRRAVATRSAPTQTLFLLMWFKACIAIEGLHPLEGGFIRLKTRKDRRPGLPVESVWAFYPKYLFETVVKQCRWLSLYSRMWFMHRRIKKDPNRRAYTDLALEPVTDDEIETRELFQSELAQIYVGKQQRASSTHRADAEKLPVS